MYGVLQEDGLLLNVSELVDKYGFENIQAAFDAPNASILATDGVFYRVPDTIGKLCRCIYFRADWLEELGIETPTTYDEMVDALRQIVEADPDGNGTTGLTCYGLWCLEGIAPSWTGYNTWGQDARRQPRLLVRGRQLQGFPRVGQHALRGEAAGQRAVRQQL